MRVRKCKLCGLASNKGGHRPGWHRKLKGHVHLFCLRMYRKGYEDAGVNALMGIITRKSIWRPVTPDARSKEESDQP